MLYILILRNFEGKIERTELDNLLSRMDRNLRLTDGVYILKTDLSAVEIRDAIKRLSDEIVIFVSAVKAPAAWKNMNAENEEIKMMLRF